MREALIEADKARRLGEVPIGAVVVCRGNLVGRGHNRRETQKDPTAHAEILAIQDAARNLGGWRLINTTLYVTVEPCFMCAGALVLARVKRLVYGVKDPKMGGIDSLVNLVQFPGINHRVEVTSGVYEAECREIIQRFFQELRKSKG
ncbi:MAG: nucleoside deaminase [Syntrophomonadaceae bacterium]|nr:nucleoside deaminase [Syntrophomonadaceae bacterium]